MLSALIRCMLTEAIYMLGGGGGRVQNEIYLLNFFLKLKELLKSCAYVRVWLATNYFTL
jgi:hypothetical protein